MDEQHPEDQDFPEIERRLAEFGSAPLPAGVADRAFARVRGTSGRKLSGGRLKLVSAAAIVGFAAGGVGLAAANVLPAPAQDVAHNALDAVGVHVPPGHVRYNDPTVCPGGPYANHGAYVRAHKNDPNAGNSPCGKPIQAVGASGSSRTTDTNDDKSDTNDNKDKTNKGNSGKNNGHGPPPWAHGNGTADDKGSESDASPTTKPEKPSSGPLTPTTTKPSTSTTSTSASTSTSSTTSTTAQP